MIPACQKYITYLNIITMKQSKFIQECLAILAGLTKVHVQGDHKANNNMSTKANLSNAKKLFSSFWLLR